MTASPLDRALWITCFADVAAIYRQSEMLSLRTLKPRLLETVAATKDALPLLKLASFGDRRTTKNSLRHDRNVREVWGLEGDYDAERLTPEDLAEALRRHNLAGLVVTSPSHREDAPRARLLLPCSTPLKPAERTRMISRLAGIIPDDLAAESWTLSQAYYVGKVGDAPRHRVLEVEGDCIDLRPDLDATAKPKPPVGKRRLPAKDERRGTGGSGRPAARCRPATRCHRRARRDRLRRGLA